MCLRVVGIVFAVVIVLITATVLMVPPIAIKGLTVFERDDSATFVSFKDLFANADPPCFFVGDLCLSEVHFAGPYAKVVNDGNSFNSSDILQKFASSYTMHGKNSAAVKEPSSGRLSLVDKKAIKVLRGQPSVTSGNLVVGMASPDELASFKGEPVYGLMVDFK